MWFPLEHADLDFTTSSRFKFDNQAVLRASPERIFDLFVDDMLSWLPDVRSVEWTSPPPHGVGATRIVTLVPLAVQERFLAWERGKRVAFAIDACSLPLLNRMVEDFRIEPFHNGLTRILYTVHYEPRTAMRPLDPLLRPMFGKMFKVGLSKLAALAST
jgi:hypothetical protein